MSSSTNTDNHTNSFGAVLHADVATIILSKDETVSKVEIDSDKYSNKDSNRDNDRNSNKDNNRNSNKHNNRNSNKELEESHDHYCICMSVRDPLIEVFNCDGQTYMGIISQDFSMFETTLNNNDSTRSSSNRSTSSKNKPSSFTSNSSSHYGYSNKGGNNILNGILLSDYFQDSIAPSVPFLHRTTLNCNSAGMFI
jgi:hypothetical protein